MVASPNPVRLAMSFMVAAIKFTQPFRRNRRLSYVL